MRYERFEDLPVWKAGIELGQGDYQLTRGPFFRQPGDLRDQLRRVALSVSNNIAEGSERKLEEIVRKGRKSGRRRA